LPSFVRFAAVVNLFVVPSVISSVSKSVKSIAISFAFAVIPVPPATFSVTSPVVPPPVKPSPAVTAVISPPPLPPDDEMVTVPAASVILTLLPAAKVSVSEVSSVLPPAELLSHC
jgi:hypothetical protein